MKKIKHLFLAALLCCAGSAMAVAGDFLVFSFDDSLNCTVVYADGWGTGDPLTRPPIARITTTDNNVTMQATSAANAQLSVYTKNGQLVYTAPEPINPNSTLQLDTSRWLAGEYTVVITLCDGTYKQITFELK